MTDYQIVAASIRHVRPMSRRMRSAGAIALQGFGYEPRAALHRAFIGSFYCRTAIIEGMPAAMWGAAGTLLGETAYVWLVLSAEVTRMPRAILREARRELRAVMEGYPHVTATVLPDDEAAIRFASHLGFGGDNDDDDPLTNDAYRIPVGDHYAIRMVHRQGRAS